MFSVCLLLYGDYPKLAKKLLSSLDNPRQVQDFRIGLNAISNETRDFVLAWLQQHDRWKKTPVYLYEEETQQNVGKYPLMRQMILDSKSVAQKIMWFDDDSFLDDFAGPEWWNSALKASQEHLQLGSVHHIIQRNKQFEVIQKQPWYTGKPVGPRHKYVFATGGWWVVDSQFLKTWDYPFWGLYHNGGDSILGELVRQQSGNILNYKTGCQCHCESCNKSGLIRPGPVVHINVGGRKGRRGIGVTKENYVWADGNAQPDLSHHCFKLRITRYEV
jgi:hypothetical protein